MRPSAAIALFLLSGCAATIPPAPAPSDPQAKAAAPPAAATGDRQVKDATPKAEATHAVVVFDCTLDAAGNVIGMHVREPLPAGLDPAIAEKIRRLKFKPVPQPANE